MCNWRLPLLTEPRKAPPPSLCITVQSGYPDRTLARDNAERVYDDLLSLSPLSSTSTSPALEMTLRGITQGQRC